MVYTAVRIQENVISYIANFENIPYIQNVRLDTWVSMFGGGSGESGGLSTEMQAYIDNKIETAIQALGLTSLVDRVATLELAVTTLKSQVSVLEAKNIMVLKGIVTSTSSLPSSGNTSGDMYLVGSNSSDYDEYVYIASLNRFEKLGSVSSGVAVDAYSKAETDAMILELNNKITSLDQIKALDAIVLGEAKVYADDLLTNHLANSIHVPGYGEDKQILSTQTINNTKVLMWQTFEENEDKHVKKLTYDTDSKDLSVTLTDEQTLTISLSQIYTDFGIADTAITNLLNDLSDDVDALDLSLTEFKNSITSQLNDIITNDIYLASVTYSESTNKITFTMSNTDTHEVTLKEALNYHVSSVKLDNSALVFKFNTAELADITVDMSSIVGSTTDTFISDIELDATDLTFTYNDNTTKVVDFEPIVTLATSAAKTYTDNQITTVTSKIGIIKPSIDDSISHLELISFNGDIYKCVNELGSIWTGELTLDFEKYVADIGDVDLSSVYTKDEIDDKLSNLDSGSTIETKTIATDTISSDTEITVTLPENETYSDYLSFELISNDSESSGYLSYAKSSDTTINIYNVSNEELTYILRGIKGTASSTSSEVCDPHFVDEAGPIPGFTNVKIIGGQTFEVDGDLTVNGGLNANYIKSNINNSTVTFNGSTHTLQNAIALASVSDLQEVTFEDTSVFNTGSKLTIDTYNHFSGILLINDSGTVKLNTNMLFDNEQILNASGFSNGTWTQLDNKVKILTNGDNTDIEVLTADYSKIVINDYLVPDSYRTQFSGSLTIMQEAGNSSNISILANNCVVTDSSVTLSLGFKTSDEYVAGTELTFTLANVDSDRIFSSTVGNKNNCLRVNNTTNESEYIRAIFVLKRTESALTLTIKEYNSDTFLPGYSYYPYGTMSNPF